MTFKIHKIKTSMAPINAIDFAYQEGIKNRAHLTVDCNIYEGKKHIFIITPEKGIRTFNDEEIDLRDWDKGKKIRSVLEEIIATRSSENHYRTELHATSDFSKQKIDGKTIEEHIKKFDAESSDLQELNIFEPYFIHEPNFKDAHLQEQYANAEFGFIAKRLENGFLITSRGSSKRDLSEENVVYVSEINNEITAELISKEKRTINPKERKIVVYSKKDKASLNANVAARIFAERKEVNIIVHAHVQLGLENSTNKDYAPGTLEDENEVMKYLSCGESIAELLNHGIIAVGKDMSEIVQSIGTTQVYERFPEFYDVVYGRFKKSTGLVDIIAKEVDKQHHKQGAKILDLAGGTGELTKQMIERGYRNITLADKSEGMLSVARNKIGELLEKKEMDITNNKLNPSITYCVRDMTRLQDEKKYDAIVIRQAITYLDTYEKLVLGLKEMRNHLFPNGKLIFNAPNGETISHMKSGEVIENTFRYETEEYYVHLDERNTIKEIDSGRSIVHAQRALCINKETGEIRKIYDVNSFGSYKPDEFRQAIKEAGFINAKIELSKNGKTVYCVCKN